MVTKIVYRDFHDVPRAFVARYNGLTFLFDCPFDEQADDYPDMYHVYLMPELSPSDLDDSWGDLHHKRTRDLGTIRVNELQFDSTRRIGIESDVLVRLMEQNELR